MFLKQLLFIIALICLPSLLYGQKKYKASYDYQTDQLYYFSLDSKNNIIDTLETAKFKRGSILMVEVNNVNPFALSIETIVKEEKIHENSGGFSFGSLLGNIQNISGGSLNLNTPELPNGLETVAFGSRGAGGADNLQKLTTGVKALKKMILSNMQNPNLTKEQIILNIKNLASNYEDSRLPDPEDNLYLFLETLDDIISNDIESINTAIDSNELLFASRGETVKKQLRSYNIQNEQEISDIVNLYSSIESASFKQVYDYLVTADKATLEMSFTPKADGSENLNTTPLKVRTLSIKGKGGFKINNSVALTLNNYSGNAQDFFIDEEGIIGSTPDNSFVPNLSTMINFYPILGEGINFGGSFGLSIPISSDLRGINFLLGPSIFLGNENRFSLSGGVAFGPVKQLTNGLEVGDAAIGNDVDSFTVNKYDVGYYFGVSFSLFDIN